MRKRAIDVWEREAHFQSLMGLPEQRAPSVLAHILAAAAPEIGAQIIFDPQWHYAGQITFRSGRRTYFRGPSLDINPHGASEVAKDKDYAAFFLRRMGFPAVSGETFYSEEWAAFLESHKDPKAAIERGRKLGYPLVVKPNSASQGRAVFVVTSDDELRAAVDCCLKEDRVFMLQPYVQGRDYRVVVFGGEILSAYERIAPHIVGNGTHTIRKLLLRKLEQWHCQGRKVTLSLDDPRVTSRLRRLGYHLNSIPDRGAVIRVLDITNLSLGGEATDITGQLSRDVEKLCIDVTREMGLRLCGIDLIIDGDARGEINDLHILEINSSPGLDNYAATGSDQFERVRQLYTKVLAHLDRTAE